MTLKRGRNGRAMSMPGGIGTGVGIAAVVSFVGSAVLAWLVTSERVGEDNVGWGCMIIQMLASALGCLAAWRMIRHRRLLVTGITVLAYYLLLLCIGLVFGGSFEGMGTTAAMVSAGGGIAFIPALVSGGSGVRRHKISVSR